MPPTPGAPDVILEQIGPDRLDGVWPLAEPLFQKALDEIVTERTTADIRANVEAKRFQLWVIYRRDCPLPLLAAASGYIRPTPKGPVAVIDTLGGSELGDWMVPSLAAFEAAARAHGMTRIEIDGRPGWKRLLPDFRVARITLEKVL